MSEKKVIKKSDWVSNFTLIGKPVINDYTYKIDEKSEKSKWVYNALNLGVDCGEKHGTVYAEMMGGYSEENENRIYAHGKKDDGSDDFDQQITVDWNDRFKDEVLEDIGDLSVKPQINKYFQVCNSILQLFLWKRWSYIRN